MEDTNQDNDINLASEDHDYVLKIVVAGNSGVGKSSIAARYIKSVFDEASEFTIGVEFDEKVVQIDSNKTLVQFWNMSGKKMYMQMAKQHFTEAVGAILVYDVTDKRSFEDIPNWMREIQKHADDECQFLLLPNKCDFTDKYPRMKQVPNILAREFAERRKIIYHGE